MLFKQPGTSRTDMVIPMHRMRVEKYGPLIQLRLMLLSFGLLVFALPVFAQDDSFGRTWSIPMFLGNGWWQSMALDIEGNLHVAWYDAIYDNNAYYDVLAYRKRDRLGTWTEVQDVVVTGTGGFTVRNSIATTPDGMLHAAFRDYIAHAFANAPINGANNAANWPADFISIDDLGYYLSMIADQNGVLHLVASGRFNSIETTNVVNLEASPCAFCFDLFYRRSTDGGRTWESPVPISALPDSGSDRAWIFQGASGRLYITWDEGIDWVQGRGQPVDSRMVYSDDGGTTWSEPIIFRGNRPGAPPVQISAAEIDPRKLIVVWHHSTNEDAGIYYQISDDTGESWSEPALIPNIVRRGTLFFAQLDRYSLVTDRLGFVHLFAVAQPNETSTRNPGLYHLIYQPASNTWSLPQRIMYSPEQQPEWPVALVGPSNDIHLSFFIRGLLENFAGIQSNTEILKVYYSYLPGNMAAQPTVAFLPTETALPTATPFRLVEATATPVPTVRPLETQLTLTTRDNYAAQTLLGSIVIVGLLCAGVVVFIRLRGR
jgi:hypothetical protein